VLNYSQKRRVWVREVEELYISTVNPLIGHAAQQVVELDVVVLG
jgi:hypothetical protein